MQPVFRTSAAVSSEIRYCLGVVVIAVAVAGPASTLLVGGWALIFS
jgi:hypothetical protein